MKGMPDWSLCELEDIDWDEFGKSDDHIVPHRGGELVDEFVALGDAHTKPRHEVENNVGKDMYSRGATKTVLRRKEDTYFPPMKDGSSSILEGSRSHASDIVIPASCDPERIANVTALASHDAIICDYCVKDCNTDTNSNIFCSEDHILGTRVSTCDSKACLSSLSSVRPDVTDLSFLENEQKDGENDLIYYDWPDIGNFEDIDKMFRNCDSTFGQGHAGTADELSWFSSSSHTIYGLEIAFEPGLQSSCSQLGALHSKSEHHCANINHLPKNVPTTADHYKPSSSGNQSYAGWLDPSALNKAKSAAKEKVCDGGGEIESPGLTQISSEYGLNGCGASNTMGSQHSSEEKRTKRSADQMLLGCDVSAPQIYFSQQFSQQKHFMGSALNPNVQLECGLPTHQVPFVQTIEFENETKPSASYEVSDHVVNHPTQCMERLTDQLYMPQTMATEENIEKLLQRQQLRATMIAEHPHQQTAFRNTAPVQKKQLETRGDSEPEDIGLELPTVEIDSSIAQESSCMTSVFSDDISLKATSFRQLQDVLHQLDVRTKLCIRDSLYRLARSAKQRHSFAHTNNCSRGNIDTIGIQGIEASKKCADLMDAETDTNPIDRSIAHLLFHKPSEPAARSVDDATSLESQIINDQLHVPISSRALVPDQFDHQRVFGGCTDMEFLNADLP